MVESRLIYLIDIYDTDIYTDLHYKRKNIITINDFLATLHFTKYICLLDLFVFFFYIYMEKVVCMCASKN